MWKQCIAILDKRAVRSFPTFYPMELGTSTSVTPETVVLRQVKTFWTLANSSLMYGHKWGCGLSHDQGVLPNDSTWNVLSLGPDWVCISLSVAEIYANKNPSKSCTILVNPVLNYTVFLILCEVSVHVFVHVCIQAKNSNVGTCSNFNLLHGCCTLLPLPSALMSLCAPGGAERAPWFPLLSALVSDLISPRVLNRRSELDAMERLHFSYYNIKGESPKSFLNHERLGLKPVCLKKAEWWQIWCSSTKLRDQLQQCLYFVPALGS